jgi:transposase
MASMRSLVSAAQPVRVVFGGIDTHKDIHVAALLDSGAGLVGSASFATTEAGYRELLGWMGSAGTLARVGVEGTGSLNRPGNAGGC